MIEANQQTEPTVEKQDIPEGDIKILKVSEVLLDLDSGLGRPQIKEKYSLSGTELKMLFQHPTLKKRRPKRALTKISFTLVDDVSPSVEEPEPSEESTSSNEDKSEFDNFEIIT
tara:strand:+ start:10508 stop:10849 length:342 start_codon:yes stop_codon:yes gene_type:complete